VHKTAPKVYAAAFYYYADHRRSINFFSDIAFPNEGDIKMTGVENRGQISHFFTRYKN